MAFIRNVDKLIEGLENKFFTEARARAAVAPDIAVEQSRAEAAEFAEQSARQSADSQLQSNIDSEQSARQIADSALSGRLDVVEGSGEGSIKKSLQDAKAYADQKVSDLIDGAPGALDTLKEIADQLGNDESAVGALTNTVASNLSEAKSYADSKVAQEVSDRQLAVSNEQSARQSADSALGLRVDGVQGDLASEVSARQSAMSSEQSARQSADQTLSGRLDTLEQDPTTKSYVDGINSSLDSRLHILEEDPTTKSYVDGVKSNLQNQVSQEISDRQLAVSSEQQRAESAEQALSGRLGVLEQDPTTKNYVDGKVTMLEGEISQEVSDRQSAITQEASARHAEVETEKSRAMLAESGLQSSINQEISDRQSAISSEASTRSSADAAEALARQNADSALDSRVGVLEQDPTTKTYVDGIKSDLQGKIDQEKSDRQSAVTSEASSRQSADSALSLRIGVLEQDPTTKTYVDAQINGLVNGAPGTLDTLKEIADQLASDESVVGALTSTVTSNLQAAKDYADGKVSTEQSRAQAAEASILSRLAGDESAFSSALSDLNSGLSAEISNRQNAVSAEASARQSAISAETSRAETAENLIQSNLSSFISKTENDHINVMIGSSTDPSSPDAYGEVNINHEILINPFGAVLINPWGSWDGMPSNSWNSVAIGPAAGLGAVNKISMGMFAGQQSGFATISLGTQSGQNSNFGSIAIGVQALQNATGAANISIGAFSGTNMSSDGAVAVGQNSGQNAGYGQVSIGYAAAQLANGFGVTAVGGMALANASINTAQNTVVGFQSANSLVEGSANTFLGYRAGSDLTKGYSNILIGNDVQASYAESYDEVNIGNVFKKVSGVDSNEITLEGSVKVSGGMKLKFTPVSSNYTVKTNDYMLGVSDTSSPKIMTLPDPSSIVAGSTFVVKDTSGQASQVNYIQLLPSNGKLIDGQSDYKITAPYESVMVVTDGTNYYIV